MIPSFDFDIGGNYESILIIDKRSEKNKSREGKNHIEYDACCCRFIRHRTILTLSD
ncbi:hypothetical protein SANA_06020 [Gottschalkiaceae bacterium SANA]|nr:hypothetical protein SANA_06020 [Gottschalkiaceae bacterium SANA]